MLLDWARHSRRTRRVLAVSTGLAMLVPVNLRAQDFVSIFDGKTLNGWDGDPKLWQAVDGAIVGETKAGAIPKQNSFLIWRGGNPADFELQAEYRLTGGNSGIQYRSSELPEIRWVMRGYQADIDAGQKFTGQIYEERGRGFLAMRGQFASVESGHKPTVLGDLGDQAALKEFIHAQDWNAYHIIAHGKVLMQILNGHVMSGLIDNDALNRKMDGLIGIQLHTGEPMKIEVRNILLKKL